MKHPREKQIIDPRDLSVGSIVKISVPVTKWVLIEAVVSEKVTQLNCGHYVYKVKRKE